MIVFFAEALLTGRVELDSFMNEVQRFAKAAFAEIETALKETGYFYAKSRMSSTVYTADYATQEDLDFFKPGWLLEDYRGALAEFERLSASASWKVNTQSTLTRKAYGEFCESHFLSPTDFVLKMLGLNNSEDPGVVAFGLFPMVIISQPQSKRAVRSSEDRFAIVSDNRVPADQ